MTGSSLLMAIRPELADDFCSKDYLFGRNAIYAALSYCKATGCKRIWMPAYSCGDEIAVATCLEFDLKFYKIKNLLNPNLNIDLRQVRHGDVVLLVHFFGRADYSIRAQQKVKALKDKGCIVIEDAAYALFTQKVGAFGDFIIFSLRKNLPVPHGAILCHKKHFKIQEATAPPREIIDYEIENFESYQRGEQKLGTGYHAGINPKNTYGPRYEDFGGYRLGCSDYIVKLLNNIDLDECKKSCVNKLKKNVEVLSGRLPQTNLSIAKKMINEGVCSQFLPIIVKDSSVVYKTLQENKKNFAIPMWNRMHPFVNWKTQNEASAMKQRIIALHLAYPTTIEDLAELSDIILRKELSV